MAHSGECPHVEPGDPEALDDFAKHSLATSMFFPQSRLMIAGNPKVAGTSLRWWLLPLHGVDVESLTRNSLWGESAPFQTIWDGGIDLTFTWNYLSAESRNDALSRDRRADCSAGQTSGDPRLFCVVREVSESRVLLQRPIATWLPSATTVTELSGPDR